MKEEKFDPVRKDAMDTHNLAEAEFWFSEWSGAIFYFLISFGRKSFKEVSDRKHLNRNVWTGSVSYTHLTLPTKRIV